MTPPATKSNRIPDLVRQLEYLATHHVEIGIFSGATREDGSDMLEIAYTHEFGGKSTVDTDEGPVQIWVPERSYLRAWFDQNTTALQDTAERLLGQVLDGKITGHAALDAIGGYAATHIQQFMVDLKHPPNAPITIARKGSSNPLIDTGQLMNSVTWRVVGAK
jgi:phage gpG-like protein